MREKGVPAVFVQVTIWFVGLLLAVNVFFVKRLVDKLDQTESTVWQLRQDIVVLQTQFDQLKKTKTCVGKS